MTLDLTHPIAGNRYQHRKGGTYTAMGTAKVQTDAPLADYAEVVVYQSEDAERSIWVRPVAEFTDGRFTSLRNAPIPSPNDEFARPIETAPRDNTIVRLLVEFETGTNRPWLPLTDDVRAWTLGSNGFDHTDDDTWQFVGWSWSQDCFVDCHAPEHGKVVGWLPFYNGDASGAERDSLRDALSKVLRGIGVAKLGLTRDGVQHAKLTQMEAVASAALSLEHRVPDALADMERRKDAAYEERNKVVAALAKLFPSGICKTDIPGWSHDWHGCVRVDLPTGQVSWHYHDSQAHLFADLPPYQGEWDGHDTQEKYRRLAALSPEPQASNAGASIYVASKTRHAPVWQAYRERGWPINSTWIDEAGVGESGDLNDLWRRCIGEASSAAVLVVYREPDDVLKGGWVEVGAALAIGVPVYAVGIDGFTIAHDKRIRHFETLDDAMDAAARCAALAVSGVQAGRSSDTAGKETDRG